MLTRDWSIVSKFFPELGQAVRTIEAFLKSNTSMRHVEPARLARQFNTDLGNLVLACEVARDRKLVKRSFGMIAPTTRCHAQGYWDRLSKIPKVLYDTGDDRFRRSDGTLIIVYRHPEDGDDD